DVPGKVEEGRRCRRTVRSLSRAARWGALGRDGPFPGSAWTRGRRSRPHWSWPRTSAHHLGDRDARRGRTALGEAVEGAEVPGGGEAGHEQTRQRRLEALA